jgi:hypothetical protein
MKNPQAIITGSISMDQLNLEIRIEFKFGYAVDLLVICQYITILAPSRCMCYSNCDGAANSITEIDCYIII